LWRPETLHYVLPSTATAVSVAVSCAPCSNLPVAHNLQVVAINEPANLESMAYLTRYDSTHGRFPGQVELGDGTLMSTVNRSPSAMPARRKTLIGAASGSIW
jgi:glyceraldehyde-3-phosphate dehydrogenase/erythrose-4-phosphate dehydrogenase